jgi:protoheme IX farnesyltransferase
MNPSPKLKLDAALPMVAPFRERSSTIRTAAILLELTKARLVSLVVVTTAVGFLMATPGGWSGADLAWTLAGTALAAAGSMALNQRIEVEQDARMERTRLRPLPSGAIGLAWASLFGVSVATAGVVLLAWRTNWLTAALGLVVIGIYTLVYTPMKRRTTACTLAGAVCGAIPPMMGWSAATGSIGFGAWILAGILFLWQIPHFLALAWLYRDDYERGGFRMLPIVDPAGNATVLMVVLYSFALVPVGLAATLSGMAGWTYALGSLLLGGALLALGASLARSRSLPAARRVFFGTLIYLPLLLGLMVADRA